MIRVHAPKLAIAAASLALLEMGAAQAASQTLEKIREVGKISFGYREASIPFAYLGADQKPTGLSLDLCAAVADKVKVMLQRLELEVEYVPVNASNRIPLLQNSTIDVECGSTTNTAERQKQVAFSVATYVASPRWLVSASSQLMEPKGLDGQTVVITQGSLNFGVAKKLLDDQKLNVTIVQAKDHAESLLMLGTGRATAWFEDDILVAGLVANASDPRAFRMLAATYAPSYYGLVTRREDPEFKAVVDAAIKEKMASGEFGRLYAKWFESPIPPKGENLQLPMSEAMKARVASPSDALVP
ncbi:amino acid ABC transporter substrate-binding protein [Bradyrhizobium canariense]|jgi:glutamate/aspartate transport system substrate-binding protein|uniref:amino acid ABC transporter substrate-binding protein n=1 Tax=Bradyrhizobium TaxID=374 RepID=UPI001C6762F3|nr:amino acid ABC transporter substrate-binding protein [Bradyrhizobium canariense]MBW5439842.1 amino acid ABC transporter substrate-binding protein [Bradyrhizobium canariense]